MKKTLVLAIVAGMLSVWAAMAESITVIPGLEGFGTDTRAAYGAVNPPEICIVDSLLTTPGNPSWDTSTYSVGVFRGTLIQCLEGLDTLNGETIDGHVVLPNSGKIVLFEKSGTIHQTGVDGDGPTFVYKVGSYTTIAGQTSPNPGILLRNIGIYGGSQHDILIQHLRGRMDGPPSIAYGNHKSFQFPGSADTYNLVIDHVSSAWGADGNICLYKSSGCELYDITLSNCIMAEGRENMGLIDEEADNAKNCLFGGPSSNSVNTKNILLYGNLLSNTKKRNPRVTQGASAIVNNYLYNNAQLGIQLIGTDNTLITSIVGNVQKGGPMSGTYTSNKMPNFMYGDWDEPLTQHRIYLYDNKADLGTQTDSTDWLSPGFAIDMRTGPGGIENPTNIYKDIVVDKTNYIKVTGENPATDAPIWPVGLNLMSSNEVKNHIIANAGAYPAFRDSLDARFINEMITGTGPSSRLQGTPSADDWPVLAANVITLDIPSNPHGDDDGDGYTNLEEWLHKLAAEVEGKDYCANEIWVETPVTSTTINTAIASAQPGDCVIIPDGIYNNVANSNYPYSNRINVLVSGTNGNEITIKPATVGGVTFTGTFFMQIGESGNNIDGNYIIVKDFKFENIESYSPLTITTKVIGVYGDNARITNNYFHNISASGNETLGYIVKFYSGADDGELDHNTFKDWWSGYSAECDAAMRFHIHHNYFENSNISDPSTHSTIHLGVDNINPDLDLMVEYNYFANTYAGAEAIDNKASNSTYRYNVFKGTPEAPASGITLRGGSGCTVESNYFINVGANTTSSKDAPVRLYDSGHKIINNYIEGATSVAAIHMGAGAEFYADVDNILIANNTIINSSQYGIITGYTHLSDTPPSNLYFRNNIITQNAGYLIGAYPHTGDFIWTDNLFWNQGTATYWRNVGGGSEPGSGITHADPNLTLGTYIYRLQSGSTAAIGKATVDENVTDDIDGHSRDATNPDIGCDEYSASAPIRTPVTEDEVGPDWIGNPPLPTCQNQGYHCCYSCLAEHYPEYDCDCAGLICCQSCMPPLTIPQDDWSLLWVDSEETEDEDGRAINSFDGDPDTLWHTEWPENPPHPHEIQIDLGGFYDICGFRQLPRQGEYPNGMIKDYEFYVSGDSDNWGTAVASGTFANDQTEKQVSFDRKLGRRVRLVAISEVNDNPWTTMAELNVLAVQPDTDINDDGKVNIEDFAVLSVWWDDENACSPPDWCGGADFDMSGTVDFNDLAYFVENWLRQTW